MAGEINLELLGGYDERWRGEGGERRGERGER